MRDLQQSIWDQRHAQGAEGCVKTASDLERYRRLLADVHPAVIIETGTFSGVSACWFADEARCWVITIDTHPQVAEDVASHPRVTWVTGNSVDKRVVDEVRHLIGAARPVMVVLDSDHSADHVHAEMLAYAPLVTVGSYLVVEDGIVRWLPEQLPHYGNSSPLDAVELFLAENPDDWVVDTDIEDMLPTTQHPSGWLRRVS